MASGSLKDTFKILDSLFAGTTFSNVDTLLPKEGEEAIDAYFERHPDIDEHDSHRLNEELQQLYATHIATDQSENKTGPFIRVLVRFRAALKHDSTLENWWFLAVEPVFNDGKSHWKSLIGNARQFVLTVLSHDADVKDDSNAAKTAVRFVQLFLETYLKHTRQLVSGQDDQALTKEVEIIKYRMERVLALYGERKPKEFLLAIDPLILVAESRIQALSLLSVFLKDQHSSLNAVLKTPLVERLLKCLMIDTSAPAISLALSCLIMILPHIPTSVVTHLPRLFLIYSRLVCWERFRTPDFEEEKPPILSNEGKEDEDDGEGGPDEHQQDEEPWDKLDRVPSQSDSVGPLEVLHFFTFLYGLYPLNFTSYIRKPRKYLKSVNFPGAQNFYLDQTIIKARTEKYQSLHLMHPNFYTTTIDDELTEGRWSKSSPTDVVAECIKLCIADALLLEDELPAPASVAESAERRRSPKEDDESDDDGAPPEYSLLGRPRSSQASTLQEGSTASVSHIENFELSQKSPSTAALSSPRGTEQSPILTPVLHSQPFFKGFQLSEQRRASAASFGSATVSEKARAEEAGTPVSQQYALSRPHSHDVEPKINSSIELLQEENILLKNKLNVETQFRKHYATHFRVLNGLHLKETRVEQETQNLINTNKSLKAKLARSHDAYITLKNETAVGRTQSKKWEKELTTRLRKFKEDEKEWKKQEEMMTIDIKNLQLKCETLTAELTAKRVQVRHLDEANLSLRHQVEKNEESQVKMTSLEEKMKVFKMRCLELQGAKEEETALHRRLEIGEERIASILRDARAAKAETDREIRHLREQNLAMQDDATLGATPGTLSPQIQSLLDSAVAIKNDTIAALEKQQAERAVKFRALKKDHAALRKRVHEIESRFPEAVQDSQVAVDSAGESTSTPRSIAWAMGHQQHHQRSATPMSASEDESNSAAGVAEPSASSNGSGSGTNCKPRPQMPLKLGAFHPATMDPSILRTPTAAGSAAVDAFSAIGDILPLGTPLFSGASSAPMTPSLTATSGGGVMLDPSSSLSSYSPRVPAQQNSPRLRSSMGAVSGNDSGDSRRVGALAAYANSRHHNNAALGDESVDSIGHAAATTTVASNDGSSKRRGMGVAFSPRRTRSEARHSLNHHGSIAINNSNTSISSTTIGMQKPKDETAAIPRADSSSSIHEEDKDDYNNNNTTTTTVGARASSSRKTSKTGGFRGMRGIM